MHLENALLFQTKILSFILSYCVPIQLSFGGKFTKDNSILLRFAPHVNLLVRGMIMIRDAITSALIETIF